MATYKGCFPGTFQEPHHVTGPAPAPPPRLAASRGPTHREPPPLVTPGQAVASNLLPSPPGPRGPNPSAQQRGGRRAANQMFASDVTNRGRHGRRERELSSGTLDGGDLLQFEASEMMLNCTASSETGAFLGQSEEGLASKVCQFHWSFQPPVVPRGISPSTKFHSPFIDEKEKAPPENNLCDILGNKILKINCPGKDY
ncbi:uncharacterized protein LOC133211129 isoform X3 [Neopsephotus bourkii]|uniref:uncharacterized protein LOC133211129 isoform X3 n=1 Tax=Neopsephotus bourkii TaxID=309878 RepID=UPI002AA5104B|nr:uncharacterized protein LOC133211129 isoform X3 [Neopsephotus bourkii]